tara:strand:- start:136 stop:1758 length:1623 start_codon:yes stop_codon:yes gene_type:complete
VSGTELEAVDIAVIGSGIAGLFLAVECARSGLTVAVVTKKEVTASSTNWAQGGIAGVLDPDDSEAIESHVKDTLESGAGLCDEEVVRSVISEASERIRDLIGHGVEFDHDASGKYDMVIEGGHSGARILHSRDRTGAEIERALTEVASGEIDSNFVILENWMAVDLIQKEHGNPSKGVSGVWCLSPEGVVMTLPSRVVVLATGGSGMMHRSTTNPSIATGDGVAMASRAGADIRDMEFIQFHPTALHSSNGKPFLITEALRGHGAVLMTIEEHSRWRMSGADNPSSESFMLNYSTKGSLDTRDVVARAIDTEMKRIGATNVLLVTEHLDKDELLHSFPTIAKRLDDEGIALGKDPIPVTPAAHYMVGGVSVDEFGRAMSGGKPMQGLYAIGEVACTGLHGANRLASNSLLEAVVYSGRASRKIIGDWRCGGLSSLETGLPRWRSEDLSQLVENIPLITDLDALRATMTQDVGLVKSDARLDRAGRRVEHIEKEVARYWMSSKPTQDLIELRNLVLVSKMVIEASKSRRGNVGLHYNIDLH